MDDSRKRYDSKILRMVTVGYTPAFKTLEESIRDLWASRGFEVISEEFGAIKGKKQTYRWLITARGTSHERD